MRPSTPPTLDEIATRYGGWIRGKLRSRFAADADDLEQEAMLRMAQALPRMRKTDDESVRALISRVLRSVMVDEVRRRKRIPPPSEAADDVADPRAADTERADARDAAETVEALFGYLTEEQRRILVLRFQHGLGFREISEILEIPQGTVAGWYSRAVGVLKENLS